jgi:TPR repeat protein
VIEEFSILPDAEQFREVVEALATKLRGSLMDALNRANADLEQDEGAAMLELITKDGDGKNKPEDLRSALTLLLSAAIDEYAEAMTEMGQIFEVLGQYPEAVES